MMTDDTINFYRCKGSNSAYKIPVFIWKSYRGIVDSRIGKYDFVISNKGKHIWNPWKESGRGSE
jgi:hypothetical protein